MFLSHNSVLQNSAEIHQQGHENTSGMPAPLTPVWVLWAACRSAYLPSRRSSQGDTLTSSYTRAIRTQGCPLGARLMKKKTVGFSFITPLSNFCNASQIPNLSYLELQSPAAHITALPFQPVQTK